MTEWLDDHPGGREIIETNKSRDVTPIFNPRHPSDQLEPENLPPTVYHLGVLDTESASEEEKEAIRLKVSKDEEDEQARIERERDAMEERGLGVVVNMKDFEVGAVPAMHGRVQAGMLTSRDSQSPC
jgi:L-lactate dehydrogenase (cytochrome)